jgi:hypothetical protein
MMPDQHESHPLVAAVFAVTPRHPITSEVAISYERIRPTSMQVDMRFGRAEPIAARQAAALLRWLVVNCGPKSLGCWCGTELTALADEIDPPEPTP